MSEVDSQSLQNRTICYCCLDLCVINTETDKRRCADMLEECYGIVMPKQVSGMCGVCRASLRAAFAFRRQVENCSLLLTGQIEQKQSTTKMNKDLDTAPENVETVGDADWENDVCRDQKEEMNMAENYDDDNGVYSEDYLEDDFYDEQNYVQDNGSGGRIKINIKSNTVPDSSPIKIEIQNKYDRKPLKEERKNSNQTRSRVKLEPLDGMKIGNPSSHFTHVLVRSGRDPHFTKRYSNNRINMTKLLYASTLIPFNTRSSMFICLYCTESECYSTMDQLKEHIAMAHGNIKFSQVLRSCVKKRTPRINVEASEVKCKACNNSVQFRTLKALVDHLIEEHEVAFLESDTKPQDTVLPFKLKSEHACFCCDESFQTFKMLMLHTNTHFGDYVCEICGKGFPMRANLRTHSKSHLKHYVICPICGKQLNKNNLSQHIKFSHKRKHCCAFCSKVFKTMSEKRHHEIDFHGKYKNLPTICEICGKEYAYYNLLRAHIRNVHLGLKPEKHFECNECGNRYKDKSALRHHMYSHFDENQFKCMVCEKKLKTQRCLRNHMKIHMNDLRWSCALCEKRFLAKPSLRNHIASHHEGYGSELMVYTKTDLK